MRLEEPSTGAGRSVAGGRKTQACPGPFLSQGIRDGSPGFTPGLSVLEQVSLDLRVHSRYKQDKWY